MADPSDDQGYFGGLGQTLLGKLGVMPAPNTGLGATLTQGLAAAPPPKFPPAGHLLGQVPTFAPPALGDSVQPVGVPIPGNADDVSQEIGQELVESRRPDLGPLWNAVRDVLPRGFSRDMFDNYVQGEGDQDLDPNRFQDIVNTASKLQQPQSTVVTGPNGEQLQRRVYNFSASPDYKLSLGSASLFYDQDGKPVGFYDDYNFDPAINKRSWLHEAETRTMHAMHPLLPAQAKPFQIRYGMYVPPT